MVENFASDNGAPHLVFLCSKKGLLGDFRTVTSFHTEVLLLREGAYRVLLKKSALTLLIACGYATILHPIYTCKLSLELL